MTLVELLATLVLVTLVTSLIWTTISLSSRYNIMETSKLRLQQEGNYISTEMLRIHRSCIEYELLVTTDKVTVENCEIKGSSDLKNFNISQDYIYSIDNTEIKPEGIRYEIEPSRTDLKIDEFKITDPKEIKFSISFPLIASRYKKSS